MNTGFSFFIIKTARLIVAMVVLFAICKPIAAGVDIAGVESLAPNCEGRIKALCDHTENGELKKVSSAEDRDVSVTFTPWAQYLQTYILKSNTAVKLSYCRE
uniref:Putative secreted protein n=1 Tax=Ixodes ricinus TaxID=34613 RepID=A0A6B0U732_IXORI